MWTQASCNPWWMQQPTGMTLLQFLVNYQKGSCVNSFSDIFWGGWFQTLEQSCKKKKKGGNALEKEVQDVWKLDQSNGLQSFMSQFSEPYFRLAYFSTHFQTHWLCITSCDIWLWKQVQSHMHRYNADWRLQLWTMLRVSIIIISWMSIMAWIFNVDKSSLGWIGLLFTTLTVSLPAENPAESPHYHNYMEIIQCSTPNG